MKILIGCKLPHGICLTGMAGQDVKLNGMNTSLVAGGFGLSNIDADEWAYLEAIYKDFPPFVSKSIFTAGSAAVDDIRDMGIDLSELKTGFEGMDPEKPAPGMQPENAEAVSKAKEAVAKAPRPAAAPKSAADKAAANEIAGKK